MNQTAKKALTLTSILVFSLLIINLQTGVSEQTLNVPHEFPTITAALSTAEDGDTIKVSSGTYQENIVVTKSVHIVGENPATTILIGEGGWDRGARPVVTLAADGATLTGLTVESQNYTQSTLYAMGIYVQADNCKISGCTIRNCYLGIFSSAQADLTIEDNTVENCLKDGMRFYGGVSYTIQGNLIKDNAVSGIALQGYFDKVINNTFVGNERSLGLGSSYSVVYGNHMLQNAESAIFLAGSNNTVAANQIEDNKWGVFVTPQLAAPHDNTFYHNNFVDNSYGVFVNESSPLEFWDGGADLGGNYWSDYTAKYPQAGQSGGIYDAPYQVYEGAQDNYPLTAPFDIETDFNPPAHPQAPEIQNGLVAYWTFDSIDATGVSPDQTGKNPAILGSEGRTRSYLPQTVPGEVGEALAFDGQQYVNVLLSPSLEISDEVTVDIWVNVQDYKDIPYNNIIVNARRGPESLPNRTFGVALNGEMPQNSSSPEVGAIRGYVLTNEGLNEIVTTKSAIELNTWTHIVFTRSLNTGMHIYVNGQEQEVTVTSGSQNPQGATLRQTETYIGHDAVCTIDELKLSNVADYAAVPLWMQWGLWAAIAAGLIVAGVMMFALRHNRTAKPKPHLGKV